MGMGLGSLISSKVSWSGFTTLLSKLAFYAMLLVRKKVLFALALATTFQSTIRQALLTVNSSAEIQSVLNSFVSEAYNKFLGAAPELYNGLQKINQGNFLEGGWQVWTGIAALYMLIYMWNAFRGRVQNTEVDDIETGLVLLVWMLASALVHDPSIITGIFTYVAELAGSLADLLPKAGASAGDNGLNSTINNTSPQ
jgi:hypothetical protein